VDVERGEARVSAKQGHVTAPLLFGTFPKWAHVAKDAITRAAGVNEAPVSTFRTFNPALALSLSRALGWEAPEGACFLPTGTADTTDWCPWILVSPKEPRAFGILMPCKTPDKAHEALASLSRRFVLGVEEAPAKETSDPVPVVPAPSVSKPSFWKKGRAKKPAPIAAAVPEPEPLPTPEPAPAPEPLPVYEVPYRCVCSYPHGPHDIHCINYNDDRAAKAHLWKGLPAAAVRPGWTHTGG
jgi:hypothetical protein